MNNTTVAFPITQSLLLCNGLYDLNCYRIGSDHNSIEASSVKQAGISIVPVISSRTDNTLDSRLLAKTPHSTVSLNSFRRTGRKWFYFVLPSSHTFLELGPPQVKLTQSLHWRIPIPFCQDLVVEMVYQGDSVFLAFTLKFCPSYSPCPVKCYPSGVSDYSFSLMRPICVQLSTSSLCI